MPSAKAHARLTRSRQAKPESPNLTPVKDRQPSEFLQGSRFQATFMRFYFHGEDCHTGRTSVRPRRFSDIVRSLGAVSLLGDHVWLPCCCWTDSSPRTLLEAMSLLRVSSMSGTRRDKLTAQHASYRAPAWTRPARSSCATSSPCQPGWPRAEPVATGAGPRNKDGY
jgi:hypothetical protein